MSDFRIEQAIDQENKKKEGNMTQIDYKGASSNVRKDQRTQWMDA